MKSNEFDVVLVGGGLSGGLIALAVLAREPGCRLALVEAHSRVGGNHTWCFHSGDLDLDGNSLVDPLVAAWWPGYDVSFPGRARTLATPYAAVTSERFASVIESTFALAPAAKLFTGRRATRVGSSSVELDSGELLRAPLVVDARGPERAPCPGRVAYQKFLGLELVLERPHSLERPLLMDARVLQVDGFRFFYLLPFGPNRVLVEDTRYSDHPGLDRSELRSEVLRYARERGLEVSSIAREETGVLPIPLSGAPEPVAALPLQAGYGGGWFHATTGYSFPAAVRMALHVAKNRGDIFGRDWARLCRDHRRQQRFFGLLNRMLFTAFAPAERWNVLERFHALPEPTIARFYAMTTTTADRARILCGRPPRGLSVRLALSQGAPA